MKTIRRPGNFCPRSKGSLKICLLILAVIFGFAPKVYAEDFVKIKLLAINPSETKPLKTQVTHLLPPEVLPEHVVDSAGMKIEYDNEKKTFFLSKEVELQPKETATIVIKIKNAWVISEEQVAAIRTQIQAKMSSLEGTKYAETAKLLFQKALDRIDQIEQEKTIPIGITQRIELYRSHVKQLNEIQESITSMESMRKLEFLGEQGRSASFVINAENPAKKEMKMTVRAELPKDIGADDVLDKLDFNMLYDNSAERFVVEKIDTFGPAEAKKYTVTLRDIWFIPRPELDFLTTQNEKMKVLFKDTSYESFAEQGMNYIAILVQEIHALQEEVGAGGSINERIRAHVLNQQKLKLAKGKSRELQDLLMELPLEKTKASLVEQLKRGIREVQKIMDATKELSMGIDPTKTTTWWIIFGIIGFLAVLVIIFYVTWLGKLNKNPYQAKPQAGTKPAK